MFILIDDSLQSYLSLSLLNRRNQSLDTILTISGIHQSSVKQINLGAILLHFVDIIQQLINILEQVVNNSRFQIILTFRERSHLSPRSIYCLGVLLHASCNISTCELINLISKSLGQILKLLLDSLILSLIGLILIEGCRSNSFCISFVGSILNSLNLSIIALEVSQQSLEFSTSLIGSLLQLSTLEVLIGVDNGCRRCISIIDSFASSGDTIEHSLVISSNLGVVVGLIGVLLNLILDVLNLVINLLSEVISHCLTIFITGLGILTELIQISLHTSDNGLLIIKLC